MVNLEKEVTLIQTQVLNRTNVEKTNL
jgi:hypothetical protein